MQQDGLSGLSAALSTARGTSDREITRYLSAGSVTNIGSWLTFLL